MGYHAGKPIESVVYCFYKITFYKTKKKVFYKFTGTINRRFLTNQNAYYLRYFIKNNRLQRKSKGKKKILCNSAYTNIKKLYVGHSFG